MQQRRNKLHWRNGRNPLSTKTPHSSDLHVVHPPLIIACLIFISSDRACNERLDIFPEMCLVEFSWSMYLRASKAFQSVSTAGLPASWDAHRHRSSISNTQPSSHIAKVSSPMQSLPNRVGHST